MLGVELCSPKTSVPILTPTLTAANVTSLRNRIFEDIIELRWVPSPMTSILMRRGKFGHRDAQREDHVKLQKKEGHVMSYTANRSAPDCWQPPEARKKTWNGFCPQSVHKEPILSVP